MLKVKRFLLFSLGSTSVEACAYMLGASLVSGWEASECIPTKCLRCCGFSRRWKLLLWGIHPIFFCILNLEWHIKSKASTAQVWFLKLSPTLAVSWLKKNHGPYVKPPARKKIGYREVSLHVGQGWCSSIELRFLDFPFGNLVNLVLKEVAPGNRWNLHFLFFFEVY